MSDEASNGYDDVPEGDRCRHELHPLECDICLHGVAVASAPAVIEYEFIARKDGQCPSCNLPIRAGTVIAKMSSGVFFHQACAHG